MTLKRIFCLLILFSVFLFSCNHNKNSADAYGNFEATEVLVSSQLSGPLVYFNVEEGHSLKAGEMVGIIDTLPLILKQNQLVAQRESIASRNKNIVTQTDVLNQQRVNLQSDLQRFQNLVKDGSATQKQLDDITGRIEVISKQILSVESQNTSVFAEVRSVDAQISQLNDQIKRSYIINPIDGIVLTKYTEQSEIAVTGKNLYKIANLGSMELRVYISGEQLSSIKIGQQVKVMYDSEGGTSGETQGRISWIASAAEFTPKIVQTKEQRTNLVYAVKISVNNPEGRIKIGMPGEMKLATSTTK